MCACPFCRRDELALHGPQNSDDEEELRLAAEGEEGGSSHPAPTHALHANLPTSVPRFGHPPSRPRPTHVHGARVTTASWRLAVGAWLWEVVNPNQFSACLKSSLNARHFTRIRYRCKLT
jgi:hypothetical protein